MTVERKREATVQHLPFIVIIRMTGGPDCLWLNMYLDTKEWQMTCDSDVGAFSYHWGRGASRTESFEEFCCRWLNNEEWLLRKCVGEMHLKKAFNYEATREKITQSYMEGNEYADLDLYYLDEVFAEAAGYDEVSAWSAALQCKAETLGVDLPEEWYECIVEEYTPQQKRFAEICREVIVPELKKIVDGEKRLMES